MGRVPKDVLIEGDRLKKDVIRADRADGIFLRNVWVEQGAFNDIDVVETNGFRLRKLVTPYGQNYGVLSFASDHGLYEHIEAFGNGDSGIYPGSGPEGHCKRYGIEIRHVNSHHNVLGYSGTAGNGTWTRNSTFHHNNAGISDDSFASGHPGMPQDCSKWNANQVYSNNENYFTNDHDAYCKNTPFEKRPKEIVCPQFQVPVGSGFILYGVNANLIQDNAIYDNWRSGVRLFWVPAAVRGENDPAKQYDTSNGNKFIGNQMSLGADNKRAPNGVDFFWATATHLASWAGMCPANNITGGKRRPAGSLHGNRWLGEILNQCAVAASHTRDTYLAAQYWQLTRRIGRRKAAVAVGHSLLVICWHLLINDTDYDDLGGDYFTRHTDRGKRPRPTDPPTPRPRIRSQPHRPRRRLTHKILLTDSSTGRPLAETATFVVMAAAAADPWTLGIWTSARR